MKILILVFIIIFIHNDAYSHSGGTNSSGCHNNRKTGDYHCHGDKPGRKDYKNYDARRTNPKSNPKSNSNKTYGHYCRITKVIDGDTVICDRRKIRLSGINAPELYTGYYAQQSKNYLTSRILGKKVFIKYPDSKPTYGYYGRLLGTIFYNRSNINLELLRREYVLPH